MSRPIPISPLICTDADWYPQEKGLFNYKKSGTICRGTTNSGKYAYGDNGGGFFIQLTGNGCNGVNWYPVYNLIKSIDPDCHVTRIDFAYDDYEGKYSFKYWDNLAASDGFYAGVGRKPNINRILNSDQSKGNTLDVGSKQTGKQIEFYEKGKQLGLGESPWVRAEVRYTSSGTKDLPLEMMLNPSAYFLGANKALMVLNEGYDSGVSVPPPKAINELKVSLDVLVANAKRSYGKLVRTMKRDLDMSTDKIVSMLEADKDGLPKRMNNALYS